MNDEDSGELDVKRVNSEPPLEPQITEDVLGSLILRRLGLQSFARTSMTSRRYQTWIWEVIPSLRIDRRAPWLDWVAKYSSRLTRLVSLTIAVQQQLDIPLFTSILCSINPDRLTSLVVLAGSHVAESVLLSSLHRFTNLESLDVGISLDGARAYMDSTLLNTIASSNLTSLRKLDLLNRVFGDVYYADTLNALVTSLPKLDAVRMPSFITYTDVWRHCQHLTELVLDNCTNYVPMTHSCNPYLNGGKTVSIVDELQALVEQQVANNPPCLGINLTYGNTHTPLLNVMEDFVSVATAPDDIKFGVDLLLSRGANPAPSWLYFCIRSANLVALQMLLKHVPPWQRIQIPSYTAFTALVTRWNVATVSKEGDDANKPLTEEEAATYKQALDLLFGEPLTQAQKHVRHIRECLMYADSPLLHSIVASSRLAPHTLKWLDEQPLEKRLLLDCVDVNLRDMNGRSAIFFGDSKEVIQWLVDRGADVNATDVDGISALELNATLWNHETTVENLMEVLGDSWKLTPALVNSTCEFDRFYKGAAVGTSVVDRVLTRAEWTFTDEELSKSFASALHSAAKFNRVSTATLLLNSEEHPRVASTVRKTINNFHMHQTPLHCLVAVTMSERPQEALPMLRLLLECGANVNVGHENGDSPLHNVQNLWAAEHVPAVTLLLERGADVKKRDNIGRTPLHIASRSSLDFQAGKLILEASVAADPGLVNAKTLRGNTPLHLAMLAETNPERTTGIVQLLKQAGADVNIRNNAGDTAWQFRIAKRGIYDPPEHLALWLMGKEQQGAQV